VIIVTHFFAHWNCFASSINLVVFHLDKALDIYYCARKDATRLVAEGSFVSI
jgi:hypothetical protein